MEPIAGKIRVHAGLHKCLTNYSKKVYMRLCEQDRSAIKTFKHFHHKLDLFYDECRQFDICSLSGNYIDLDRFDDIRVVRVIRDPRDLIVSGYYYHKRAAEPWCKTVDPTVDHPAWKKVRGRVPTNLPSGYSLTGYLNEASLEDGLLAEIDFRKYHYQSMMEWPEQDPRVNLFRYEDILGKEAWTYWKILSFFGLPFRTRYLGSRLAKRLSAKNKRSEVKHIRDPNSGQWRKHFTPELTRIFNDRYGDILDRYGYTRE